ncbi:hypothetical protein [Actinocorallia populi]|uniref:hypothetical protein n=1 Tax=Actinocorallia populi TaxID=2079200 RepID=UPI000D08ACA2|nr:hypothetical protein [Actinocorallia populi]
MSTADRILLILHVAFAIFTLGPLTAATMSTPRYIRARDVQVLRHLRLTTRIYGLGTLGIFLFGLFLAKGRFDQMWLSASMTLFIVAFVLLLLIERDQGKVISKLSGAAPSGGTGQEPGHGGAAAPDTGAEQSRIAALAGITALLWIVILVLMIWH